MEALSTINSYSPQAAEQLELELRANGERVLTQSVPLSYHLFFEAMPAAHHEFFEALQPFHASPEVVCTHAGLDPNGGPVETQTLKSLIWGALDFPAAYRGSVAVAYGHWDNAVLGANEHPYPRIENNTFGLDTISHGVLTAVRFPDLTVFQSG